MPKNGRFTQGTLATLHNAQPPGHGQVEPLLGPLGQHGQVESPGDSEQGSDSLSERDVACGDVSPRSVVARFAQCLHFGSAEVFSGVKLGLGAVPGAMFNAPSVCTAGGRFVSQKAPRAILTCVFAIKYDAILTQLTRRSQLLGMDAMRAPLRVDAGDWNGGIDPTHYKRYRQEKPRRVNLSPQAELIPRCGERRQEPQPPQFSSSCEHFLSVSDALEEAEPPGREPAPRP